MKTKFILHGGFANNDNPENNSFFKEILRDAPEKSKILLVYFAKDEEKYDELRKINESLFNRNNNDGKEILFDVASQNNFIEQVSEANIIYLHGGKTLKLLNILKEIPQIKDSFIGKIVAGESAGAYVLSKYFYSKSEDGLFEGLGFVPVKTICHYKGVNEEKLDNGSEEEKLLLKDYQYKILE